MLQSDFEKMHGIFSKGGNRIDHEKYIKICFEIRITHEQLVQYEKDFNKNKKKNK